MAGDLLLDTSLVIDAMAGSGAAEQVIREADSVFVPIPALGELHYGVLCARHPAWSLAQLESFMAYLDVLPCDEETARHYAHIRDGLRTRGRPIPENDMWIAALARQHGLTVATRDRHFSEISGLPTIFW